jgi:hypothetical protein
LLIRTGTVVVPIRNCQLIEPLMPTNRTAGGPTEAEWWESSGGAARRGPWRNKPPELWLNRTTLHKLAADRTGHGDFRAYHERFGHPEEVGFRSQCACGRPLTNLECQCPFLANLKRPPLFGKGKTWRASVEEYYANRDQQRAKARDLLKAGRMFSVSNPTPWDRAWGPAPKERSGLTATRGNGTADPVGQEVPAEWLGKFRDKGGGLNVYRGHRPAPPRRTEVGRAVFVDEPEEAGGEDEWRAYQARLQKLHQEE